MQNVVAHPLTDLVQDTVPQARQQGGKRRRNTIPFQVLDAIVEGTTKEAGHAAKQQGTRQRRRTGVSPQRLEAIIAAAQHRGLSASAITQHADGSTTVYFGDAGSLTAGKMPPGTGWEDV